MQKFHVLQYKIGSTTIIFQSQYNFGQTARIGI